jgi:hypothetical protein
MGRTAVVMRVRFTRLGSLSKAFSRGGRRDAEDRYMMGLPARASLGGLGGLGDQMLLDDE